MEATQVIRDRNSLSIQWDSDGHTWTVKKKFNLGTRLLEPATIQCSAETWPEPGATQARELAEMMDVVFICPEDFDRVRIASNPPAEGLPAKIVGIVLGGPILLAIRKASEAVIGFRPTSAQRRGLDRLAARWGIVGNQSELMRKVVDVAIEATLEGSAV